MTERNDEIAALTAAAQDLIRKVDAVGTETGQSLVDLGATAKTNRRLIWIVSVSLTFNLILTALVGIGLFGVHNNSDRLDAVTTRLNTSQTVGRQKALCPLYTLFLNGKNDTARKNYPQGVKAYDAAFKVIQDGYNALECQDFTGTAPKLGR